MVLMARLAGTSDRPGMPVVTVTSSSGTLRIITSCRVRVKLEPSLPRHLVACPWLSRSIIRTR